jgi:hypothetical protein
MFLAAGASNFELAGAAAFGAVIGWYLYYVNRYRQDEISAQDLVTVIAAVGGGAVLSLFPAQTQLFGAYGLGLFIGFFGYFLVLFLIVAFSSDYKLTWFLKRHKDQRPMAGPDDVLPH